MMRHRHALVAILFVGPILFAGHHAVAWDHGGEERGHPQESFPEGVLGIGQSPWNVTRGTPIEVVMHPKDDHPLPDRVSLIWCRVEPDYVCAYPIAMIEQDDGAFKATIPGAWGGPRDIVQGDTRHIGYNITMVHGSGEEATRTHAPTTSPWVPQGFPSETGGHYYFVALQDAQAAAAPAVVLLLAVLALVGVFASRLRGVRDG